MRGARQMLTGAALVSALVPQPVARADPAPDCSADSSAWEKTADRGGARCQASAADGSGRRFVASFPPGHAGKVSVVVLSGAGSQLQTVEEQAEFAGYAAPEWSDVDGDGRQELVVALRTSASNTRYAVWRAHGPNGSLVRSGELFGVQLEHFPRREGLVFIRIHDSCCDGVYQLYRFDGQDKLAQVAEADWSARGDTDRQCAPKSVPGGLSLEETRSLLCVRRK